MSNMSALMVDLAALDWDEPGVAHRDAQALFAQIEDPGSLLEDARSLPPERTEFDRSAEKTTHFKWFVADDPHGRFALWLNEYKPASHRRTGHAEVAHNHRFWFTSLLLSGGFTNDIYRARSDASLELERSLDLRAGDTFVVDPDEVHALRELRDGTLTLLVQSRPVRSYSDVWEAGKVTRYHDLPSSRRAFNQRLAELSTFQAATRRHH
jgi:hypothetical protein